jgi:type II secretory pathway pseudopilin PulG
MRLTAGHRRPLRPRGGFSLLEAVVAAGLLLMTVTVVTATVLNASRAGSRLDRAMTVDRALRREVERLRSLPYCAPAYPAITQGEWEVADGAADLLDAVFPHAVVAANRGGARFVAVAGGNEEPAGCFVTLRDVDGVSITCVARFLADGGSAPLGPEAVAEWAVWRFAPPPADGLEVRVFAEHDGLRREQRVVRAALPPLPAAAGGGMGEDE